MVIVLTKHVDKPASLRCIRDDGSVTWQGYGSQGAFFPTHDLTHYALETELGYRHAFFGMIAAGRDVEDFGPGDAANFHLEAIYSEMLVGLMTTTPLRLFADIKPVIDGQTRSLGLADMPLTPSDFLRVQLRADELATQWQSLVPGEMLELLF